MASRTAGVNGLAVAAVAAGVLLAWSGFKGARVTTALRSLLSGQQPAGGALGVQTPGSGTLATGVGPGSATPSGNIAGRGPWAQAFLAALGAPLTPANVNSVVSWEAREGGGGANNPLNTTLDAPGATDFNSVGVKNYPTAGEGIQATVQTITGGQYGDILMALRGGVGLCGRSWQGLSTWSGGGYSSVC